MVIKRDNVNDLYQALISLVDSEPDYIVQPRGMEVKEMLNVTAVLTNPKACLVTIHERKLNYRFAAIEKLEYLWGKHDLDRIVAYNPNMQKYAGIYNYSDGNYAQRLNFWLDHIYHLLKKDPDSRQGVASIYDSSSRHQSGDVPCTLTLQFLIRNGALHLIVNMRSNDLLWGFPYDVNAFCFLQEVMAKWLNIPMGNYYHNAASMHIYTESIENYEQLINTSKSDTFIKESNPIWNLDYQQTQEWLPLFFHKEERTRRLGETENCILPSALESYYDLIATKWQKK